MSNIEDAIKIAKMMKKDIVYFNKNYILGTDINFFTLSIIEISLDIPRNFTCVLKDIITPKAIDKNNGELPDENIFSKLEDGYYINLWEEPTLYDNIMNTFNSLGPILYEEYKPIIDRDITDDENFRKVLSLKSDQGHLWFNYNIENNLQFLLSGFTGLYPVNASDKVSLCIYDIDPLSIIAEFKIIKKKCTIRQFIKFRKL